MPRVPTVLFILCGFATLGYATMTLGLGIWVVAPALMLLVVAASLRMTELEQIAKAAAMAAGVLTGIFVAASVVVAIVRGSLDDLGGSAPLIAGLAGLSVLGVLVGTIAPTSPKDDDSQAR